MFTTLTKMLREVYFGLFFKNMRLVIRDAVPEFGFSFVKIVD